MDLSQKTDDQLNNLIVNHENQGATDRRLYRDSVAEMHRRHGGGLGLDLTFELVRQAASERRFLSYGEVAAANGMDWSKARYPMFTHLGLLVKIARNRGWPMLSAIIVNKQNVATGEMEPATLKGFIEAALALDYEVGEPNAFLKAQQEACFAWAEVQSS